MRPRSLRSLSMTTLLLSLVSGTALAQVGHRPESSPYRDIRKGHTLTVTGGYVAGSGGEFNIGPHKGTVFGARYDIRTGSTIQLGLGFAYGDLDRFIVDPYVRLANRTTGPVEQSVTFAELDLQFNLTGGKSWNRIAPFVAAGGGLAFGSDVAADTSGYDFGRKFYFAPSVGARVFLSRRLHFRAEGRVIFWKLNYPTTFQDEPVEEPETPPVITGNKLTEWTTTPWFQVGLGYSFSP